MNEEQQAFTAYLIKILQPTDEADFNKKIRNLSEDQLKEYYKQFKEMETNKISFAKLGAKLNYMNSLKGKCPEGYEVEYFMSGGCVKCKKMNSGNSINIFKDKCGGKTKKRVSKKQDGGKTKYKDLPIEKKIEYDLRADSAAVAKAYPKSELAKDFNRKYGKKSNNTKKRIKK